MVAAKHNCQVAAETGSQYIPIVILHYLCQLVAIPGFLPLPEAGGVSFLSHQTIVVHS